LYAYGPAYGAEPNGLLMLFSSVYFLVILIGLYIYNAFALMTIANKTYTENAWMAWIPILNIYLMVKIAEKPWWWTLLILFVPILDIILLILVWMNIAEKVGKPAWMGILMILPIVNLVIIGYLAWG